MSAAAGAPFGLADLTFEFSAADVGQPTNWGDVTALVQGFTITRGGRQYDTDNSSPGTLTVTLKNDDGTFDPDNTAGPAYGSLRANRQVRARAKRLAGDPVSYLGHAYVDTYRRTFQHRASYTDLECTDAFKVYAKNRVNTGTLPQQNAGDRVASLTGGSATIQGGTGRVLVGKPYPAGGAYSTVVQLDELLSIALWDGGLLYASPQDGSAVYQSSGYRTSVTAATTSQSTWGWGAVTNVVEIDGDFELVYDDLTTANYVTVTDAGGNVRTASDSTAQGRDGTLVLDLGQTDLVAASAQARANELLARRKTTRTRVEQVTLDALTDPARMAQVLARNLSDRVTVKVAALGGGSASTSDYWIEQITHDVALGQDPHWRTTYTLAAAA